MILGLVFLLLLFAEIWNGRFWLSDFEVYYKSAVRILQGQNLYRIGGDGFYLFKYSPVSAILFIPFAVLPFWIAKIVYWAFYSFIILACINITIRLALSERSGIKPARINSLVLLTGLILMVHFFMELHLGQVTFILLALYLLSCRGLMTGKPWQVGFYLALSLLIKPFGLIFIPYLLYKGKWKEFVYLLVFMVILALIPLFFYHSIVLVTNQYASWFHEVFVELGNKQEFNLPANQTIFSVIARYIHLESILKTPLLFILFQVLILILLSSLVIIMINRGKSITKQEILEMTFLTGLIPLIAFSGENSFCLLLPATVIILSSFRKMTVPLKIISIVGFLFLGGNIHDLWGDSLSVWIDNASFISFGAMSICVILAGLRFRKVW